MFGVLLLGYGLLPPALQNRFPEKLLPEELAGRVVLDFCLSSRMQHRVISVPADEKRTEEEVPFVLVQRRFKLLPARHAVSPEEEAALLQTREARVPRKVA